MKCIILAAGFGTRMGELTKKVPKPMLFIKNKPKLAWTIEMLPNEIDEVILVVGYLKEKIIDYFGESYNNKKIIYLEQKELNGTAGAVSLGRGILEKEEKFLVLMADDFYLKSDLEKLIKNKNSTLAFKEKERAFEFGVLKVDKNNFLIETIEKPKGQRNGFIGTNAYVISKEYFKTEMFFGSGGEYWLPNTVLRMTKKFNIKLKVISTEKWFPVGNKEALKKAQEKI